VGDRDARLSATAAPDHANVSSRAASTATANSVKAPTGVTGTATANSVKAPARSYRRGSLRASSLVILAPAVLTSPGRRRASSPFHSRPHRLSNPPTRVGMKGAVRSGKTDDASTAGRRPRERSERGRRPRRAARPSTGADGGFHAVCGGGPSHSGRGFHAVCGRGPGRCCGGLHAVRGCGDASSPNGSHGSRTDGSNDGHTLLCHGDSC